MPKAPFSSSTAHWSYTVVTILSLNKVIPSLYSHYAKKELIYIALASPLS